MSTNIKQANDSIRRFSISCSICGHRLGHASNGSDSEVCCPKCRAKLNYRVEEGNVTVIILEPSTKQMSQKHRKPVSTKFI